MIVNDRLTSYLHSLDSRESEIIEAIGREARADRVPIIRQETGSLLKVLLKMNKPQRILEIGTAVAYSAILMSECLEPGATITTVEKYEKRIPIARENIRRAGKEDCITLIEGDALDDCLNHNISDWSKIKNVIRDSLGDFLWKQTKRNPMILPIIMEV